jgi:hypothetical protein
MPIGQVSNADQNRLNNSGEVQVNPAADLRHLTSVQILINRPGGTTERAQVPSGSGARGAG